MAKEPIPQSMELSAVFTAAADRIEQHDWARGTYLDAEGATCAVGAIVVAGPHGEPAAWAYPPDYVDSLTLAAVRVLAEAVPDVNDDLIERIALWNDAPERTVAEVVGLLRSLASEARRREGLLAEQRHQFIDLDADLVARWAGLAVAA